MSPEVKTKEGSLFTKLIVFISLTLAILALGFTTLVSKSTKEKISSLNSTIWTLEKKIDSDVKSLSRNINDIENQFSTLELSMIITELKRTATTVREISKGSSGRTYNISSTIISDLDYLIEDIKKKKRLSSAGNKRKSVIGEITIEPAVPY